MLKVCEICGAEYESHATYCNLCKKESLIAVETPVVPEAPPPRLIEDAPTLAFVAIVWLLGLGYFLVEVRPRDWGSLSMGWLALTGVTAAFCFAMRNLRMAAIFSAIGLGFVAIYGLLAL